MKQIITVQHTQSIHHTNGMVGSWTDWDLTDRGIAQAGSIAKNIAGFLGEREAVLYTSDLLRAWHTAKIIGDTIGASPIPSSALRERNLGKCIGKSVAWLRENMECQEQTIDDRMFSDAESRRDEWHRLAPFFEELLACEADTVIVVSHGDLLGVFLRNVAGASSGGTEYLRLFRDGRQHRRFAENRHRKTHHPPFWRSVVFGMKG